MIFGFNTDVKHGDTVYHVQSEAREGEGLLQTQVFMRGHCIGKRATPYAKSGLSDGEKEQNLRDQHRVVLDAIREGKVQEVFDKSDTPETLAAIHELDLQWLNADSVHSGKTLSLRLRVTEDGNPVNGARLVFRFARAGAAPFYTQTSTDTEGKAELNLDMEESQLPDSSVLVQAIYSGRTATRKFRLRKVE
jgi:hypothetical protein